MKTFGKFLALVRWVPWLGFGRWGYVEYRHHKLVAEGKKDENRDGVEDKPTA